MAKLTIVKPTEEPVDIPIDTNRQQGQSNNDGFNFIKWIYDFVLIKEPVCFGIMQKYKKNLDLKIEVPIFYYVFLFFSIIIDLTHGIIVTIVISILLILITLSFARGIGIFDWLPKMLGFML